MEPPEFCTDKAENGISRMAISDDLADIGKIFGPSVAVNDLAGSETFGDTIRNGQ